MITTKIQKQKVEELKDLVVELEGLELEEKDTLIADFDFEIQVEDGISETPFGYFDYKDNEIIASSEDGLIWSVHNDKQLSFRLENPEVDQL